MESDMLHNCIALRGTPLKEGSPRNGRLKLLMAVTLPALAASTVSTGPARAADIFRGPPGSLKDFPAPVVPACAIFHGFYIGGHVGGASHDWNWQDRDDWAGEADVDLPNFVSGSDSGLAGGVQAGFNWQRGCTVLGFEADWSWADLGSSKLFTDGNPPFPQDTLTVTSNVDGFGTLRTRAGVVVDSLLLYVTGGLAFADINRRATLFDERPGTDTIETFSFDDTRFGLAAGFGAEWALTDYISLKSEALWLRFEEDSQTRLCTVTCSPAESKRFDVQDDVFTARVGVNFKFGGY
jgi:outer membrane immunogenic protein